MAKNQTAFNALVTAVQNNLFNFSNSFDTTGYYSIINGQVMLANQQITSTDMQAISAALKVNNTVNQLFLNGNPIGDLGAIALSSALESNKNIVALYLEGMNNSISVVGVQAIASALQINSSLKYLYFGSNYPTSDTGAQAFALALRVNNSLELLELSGNNIGSTGAGALASALQINTALSYCDLSSTNNNIDNTGASAFINTLQNNYSLTYLYLSGNPISISNFNAINVLLSRNRQYIQLTSVFDINGNLIRGGANTIEISQGGIVNLTSTNLQASGINDTPITFNVTQVEHGVFFNITNKQPVTQFSQADINATTIGVAHDGSYYPLSYAVTASNGTVTTPPHQGAVIFSLQTNPPMLSRANFTVSSNVTTLITTDNLLATFDGVTPLPGLIFNVANVTGGQFEYVGQTQSLSSFYQADVMNNSIEFACDNSGQMPQCEIQVSDGNRTSIFVPANFTFIPFTTSASTTTKPTSTTTFLVSPSTTTMTSSVGPSSTTFSTTTPTSTTLFITMTTQATIIVTSSTGFTTTLTTTSMKQTVTTIPSTTSFTVSIVTSPTTQTTLMTTTSTATTLQVTSTVSSTMTTIAPTQSIITSSFVSTRVPTTTPVPLSSSFSMPSSSSMISTTTTPKNSAGFPIAGTAGGVGAASIFLGAAYAIWRRYRPKRQPAHGISPALAQQLVEKGIHLIDMNEQGSSTTDTDEIQYNQTSFPVPVKDRPRNQQAWSETDHRVPTALPETFASLRPEQSNPSPKAPRSRKVESYKQPEINEMRVTVYIWEPSVRDLSPGGHASLKTYIGGEEGDGIYASFWPISQLGAVSTAIPFILKGTPSKHHSYDDDIAAKWRGPDYTFNFYTLDVETINEKYLKFKSDPNKEWAALPPKCTECIEKDKNQHCSGLVLGLLMAGNVRRLFTQKIFELFGKELPIPYWLIQYLPDVQRVDKERFRQHHGVFPEDYEQKTLERTSMQTQETIPLSMQETFLQHVAYGVQAEAKKMLISNPELIGYQGRVTDHSKRTFNKITAFQYALWAWDWHMWVMLLRYLSPDMARAQLLELEAGVVTEQYEVHYNFTELIEVYKRYIDHFEKYAHQERTEQYNQLWCKEIGGAQSRVPAHVANEYCRTDRILELSPNADTIFRERLLPRVFKLNDGSWYPLVENSYGILGNDFAIVRSYLSIACVCSVYRDSITLTAVGPESENVRYAQWAIERGRCSALAEKCKNYDLPAFTELFRVRMKQYQELKEQLRV